MCEGDLVPIPGQPFDVVRGLTFLGGALCGFRETEEPIETDGRPGQGGEVKGANPPKEKLGMSHRTTGAVSTGPQGAPRAAGAAA